MVNKKVYFAQIVALLSLSFLAGCGTTTPTKPPSGETLQTRAIERWNFLIARKAENAYDYLSPGFRATKSREQYAKEMNGRGIKWQGVTFNSQDCEADTCTVRLFIDIEIDMAGSVGHVKSSSPVVETWIKEGGSWYYLPDATRSSKIKEGSKP